MLLAMVSAPAAERRTLSLDGTWQLAEGVIPTELPDRYDRTVPVPGLANLAQPPLEDVDRFISRENMANRVRAQQVPEDWLRKYWLGKVEQRRNYLWYRRTFTAPAQRSVAMLKIHKAQFGTDVWINGVYLGHYPGCFTASYWDLTPWIRWDAENELIVRVGAHPAVLPDTYPTGSDFEKNRWTPGIYDSVSVYFCDNPVIESVQIAPRIATQEVVVQTIVRNRGRTSVSSPLTHRVRGTDAAATLQVRLGPGEEQTFTQTLRLNHARRWSPGDPFLYVLDSSTAGDTVSTRFGMREFRFDASRHRALLNGQVIYLRGSNITLHRFFEDPHCGDLPWREEWVRKLLGEIPKQMNWNYFRFCIGPVPERWFDICDEVGLLVQNEFFVWTGRPQWYKGYARSYDVPEMIRQYRDWMRDHWNHPSVVVWDANNETEDPIFGERIIPVVRPLDLSGRPWENSYNPPVAPDDPVEDHPYLMSGYQRGDFRFNMTMLETMNGGPRPGSLPSDSNPRLINEYGWLWLNRDGTPTRLTERVFEHLLGPNATPRQRLDLWAYLLAAKTEFWRAHRQYAGVIHFVYLTCSYPGVYTSDHFRDVRTLELDPAFVDYVGEAFKPLGVYLNFFQPTLPANRSREFTVLLINDDPVPQRGELSVSLETPAGQMLTRACQPFEIEPLGAHTSVVTLAIPAGSGECIVKAAARTEKGTTLSRRWTVLTP